MEFTPPIRQGEKIRESPKPRLKMKRSSRGCARTHLPLTEALEARPCADSSRGNGVSASLPARTAIHIV